MERKKGMKGYGFRNKFNKITGAFAPFIAVLSVLAFCFMPMTASAQDGIYNIAISNLTGNGLTISWTSEAPETGEVRFGTSSQFLTEVAYDIRGETTEDELHYVELEGLVGQILYYYEIISGGVTYNQEGVPFQVTTGNDQLPIQTGSLSDFIKSEAVMKDTGELVEPAIIFMSIEDKDSQGSTGTSGELSKLIYGDEVTLAFITAANARTPDANAYFQYNLQSDQINLRAIAAEGKGQISVVTGGISLPPIYQVEIEELIPQGCECLSVLVGNITHSYAVISWISGCNTVAEIRFGTNPASLQRIAFDKRGEDFSGSSHYHPLTGLTANTTYNFEVAQDAEVCYQGDFSTGPELGLPGFGDALGYVERPVGAPYEKGAIVYLRIQNSSGTSSLLSSLTNDQGLWQIELGLARLENLGNYFSYISSDTLLIEAEAGDPCLCASLDDVQVSQAVPAPTLILAECGPPVTTCYRDADEDGYGDPNQGIQEEGACPEGYSKNNTDCNDEDSAINPGAQEVCNELDDDCDYEADEDLVQECSNACGATGTETCENGQWVNCTAPPVPEEVCDGEDNDCDGAEDEDLGTTTCGLGVCEHTIDNCVGGVEQTCDPMEGSSEETCDGLDNDCDGAVDEDLKRECSTICGTGTETCEDGQWVNCTAPAPPCDQVCIFTAEIIATGQVITGFENNVSIVTIGIDPNIFTIKSPPDPPPDFTIDLNIDGGEYMYKEDIRAVGPEEEEWKLNLKIGETADPNLPGYFPVISWEPDSICASDPNNGYSLKLYSEDAQGVRTLLIQDMTQISQYQTKEEDVSSCAGETCFLTFYIVWSKDVKFDMNLSAGWSMISLPVVPNESTLSALFKEAVVMYSYERETGYVRVQKNENIQVGTGYWILFYEDQNIVITGQPIHSYNKTVYSNGWEMIGGCTSKAWPTVDICTIGVIYRFRKGVGYQRVLSSETMEPGGGFWILLENIASQCNLTVEATGALNRLREPLTSARFKTLSQDESWTLFINATGQGGDMSEIEIGIDPNGKAYYYPPMPPLEFTVVLKIKGGITGYSEDIRVPGYPQEVWELEVMVGGATFGGDADANQPDFFPILSWDTSEIGPAELMELRLGDANGPILLDMRTSDTYQTLQEDADEYNESLDYASFSYAVVFEPPQPTLPATAKQTLPWPGVAPGGLGWVGPPLTEGFMGGPPYSLRSGYAPGLSIPSFPGSYPGFAYPGGAHPAWSTFLPRFPAKFPTLGLSPSVGLGWPGNYWIGFPQSRPYQSRWFYSYR